VALIVLLSLFGFTVLNFSTVRSTSTTATQSLNSSATFIPNHRQFSKHRKHRDYSWVNHPVGFEILYLVLSFVLRNLEYFSSISWVFHALVVFGIDGWI
jgi:hypothetical protein